MNVDDLFATTKRSLESSDADIGETLRKRRAPSPAPSPAEDERFTGSGLTAVQASVIDYIDSQTDQAAPEKYNSKWLAKLLREFEDALNANEELRALFPEAPAKFLKSEAELDVKIKAVSALADFPHLYAEAAAGGLPAALLVALRHPNSDIRARVVAVLNDLLDEDVEVPTEVMAELTDKLLKDGLAAALGDHFDALRTEKPPEIQEYSAACLELVQSVLALSSVEEFTSPRFISWFCRLIQSRAENTTLAEYGAEILCSVVQAEPKIAVEMAQNSEFVDDLLQLLAQFVHKKPETEESELVENCIDLLCYLLHCDDGKVVFVKLEAVELAVLIAGGSSWGQAVALRLLSHGCDSGSSAELARRLVGAGGLRVLFKALMKRNDKPSIERTVSILSNMFRVLSIDSPERIRLLGKFEEKKGEKIHRVTQLRNRWAANVAKTVEKFWERNGSASESEDPLALEAELLVEKVDAGMEIVQNVDLILAWLMVDGQNEYLKPALEAGGVSSADIVETLKSDLQSVETENSEDELTAETADLMDMLEFLITEVSGV